MIFKNYLKHEMIKIIEVIVLKIFKMQLINFINNMLIKKLNNQIQTNLIKNIVYLNTIKIWIIKYSNRMIKMNSKIP